MPPLEGVVRSRLLTGTLASVGLALLLVAPGARADSIDLMKVTGTVFNSGSNIYSFAAPGPGTLQVNLDDDAFPELFQSLSASILSSHNVLGQIDSAGTFTVPVSQAGLLFACIAGIAGNTLGLPVGVGVYSLDIGFSPAGAPVPLPEPWRLLLVGLGFVGALRLLWKRPQAGWSVGGTPARNESVTCAA